MATINLGAIKFNWKGAYNNGTAYTVDDVVSSGGSSYVCIAASTGNAVSNGTYWQQMSAAGTNGTDVGTTITTQGDILYRDGSGLQRLAKGTASQVLAINSGATAPEWVDASGGKTLQVATAVFTSGVSINNSNFGSTWAELSTAPMTISMTPQKATSKIYVEYNPHIWGHNNGGTAWDNVRGQLRYKYSSSSPTSYTLIPNNKGDGYWGAIISHDLSGLSGNHWLSAKPYLTCMHDHDTPAGETISYTLYVRSASTSSYDWKFNLFTNTNDDMGVGRIRITELDI
tara:strand:+ start:215 stop:1072 length:858 start_codon:yes stop_codon:yes gene_type:complete